MGGVKVTGFKVWGVSSGECELTYPCDPFMEAPDAAYYRGVAIHAAPATVFRWLCQMRAAPYSYDWIDNMGRKSPRELTPGLGELEVGQEFMTTFELIEFDTDRHLTLRMKREALGHKLFGDVLVSYVIQPEKDGTCRLLVKIIMRYPKGILGTLMRLIVPPGDWIMMRRQLLNFKELSERPVLPSE
jgi:hypothetical protein